MGWYKLDVRHGPGHQGRTQEYHWSDQDRMPRGELKEWYDHLTREMDWPIGKLRKIKTLPARVREDKIAEYRRKKRHTETVLKSLMVHRSGQR